jgi:hypothetical protein
VDRDGRTIWIADAHRDNGKRFIVRADEKLSAFVELEREVLTVTFYLESTRAGERDSLPYGAWTSLVFAAAAYGGRSLLITFGPICKEAEDLCRNEASFRIK